MPAELAESNKMGKRCIKCGTELNRDDISATKNFLNRGAVEFYCLDCLAAEFKVSRAFLDEKIQFLRENGCGLFPK